MVLFNKTFAPLPYVFTLKSFEELLNTQGKIGYN
jgi:hypothetical protein